MKTSPRMLRARVACLQAQAACDALSKRPEHLAWKEVMDALWAVVLEEQR